MRTSNLRLQELEPSEKVLHTLINELITNTLSVNIQVEHSSIWILINSETSLQTANSMIKQQ